MSTERRIRSVLNEGERSFSFEFFPPQTEAGRENLRTAAAELCKLHPTFVSVTYGAGGSTRENTIGAVAELQDTLDLRAMAHLTCVAHTPEELREIIRDIERRGIRNIMALRGDAPKDPDFSPPPNALPHAIDLIKLIHEEGDFSVGCAGFPEVHPDALDADSDLRFLKEKVDAGVDFIVSQLFFVNDYYFRFVERAQAAGITVPIVPGIWPITNGKQIIRIAELSQAEIPPPLLTQLERAGEDVDECYKVGVAYATAQCEELLDRDAPGIHFYTLNKSTATREIFANLQRSGYASLLPAAP